MEKSPTTITMRKKQCLVAVVVVRFIVTSLLAAAFVLFALPGSDGTLAESRPNYRVVSFGAGTDPSAAKIGDLDGDGANDIAVVNTGGSLQLFFNNGTGSFERVSLSAILPAGSRVLDVDIGDLNNDGRNDIAVACSTQTGAISVLLNQGNRSFAASIKYDTCNSSNGVAIGRF